MADLITAAEVADSLGARFAARPDLAALISAASSAVESYCRREFALLPVDERLDGAGTSKVVVSRPPIVAVSAVFVDGVELDNADGSEWYAGPYAIVRGDGRRDPRGVGDWRGDSSVWPAGMGNIRVIYSGGYETVPGEVRLGAIVMVQHLAEALKHPGLLRREKLGDYEYELSTMALDVDRIPAVVRSLINPYVHPGHA